MRVAQRRMSSRSSVHVAVPSIITNENGGRSLTEGGGKPSPLRLPPPLWPPPLAASVFRSLDRRSRTERRGGGRPGGPVPPPPPPAGGGGRPPDAQNEGVPPPRGGS